jgi:glycosyltransferase involved in cell wall biosynthesis
MSDEKTRAVKPQSAKPLVSVIIPTFNRAWCLAEAVDSVLAQEFGDFELIVVDDGSTDGTFSLLAGYGDAIRVLRRENQGVSAARNAGIAAARGVLIAFLDSDDLWLPGKLRHQVAFFASHPEALICQTEELWVRNGRRVNPGKRHRKRSGMIFEASLDLCLVSPSAVMVRRELFERVGLFDERLPACEDYDLWLRVSCRIPVHLIETPLIVKRGGHADQLSRAWGLDQFRIAAMVKLLEGDILDPVQRQAGRRALGQKCVVYAGGCRKRGRTAEAEHYEQLARAFSNPSANPRIDLF